MMEDYGQNCRLPERQPGEPLSEEQRLLRKRVLYQAREEPQSFYTGTWERCWDRATTSRHCGTTRCVSGWAVHLTRLDLHAAGVQCDSLANSGKNWTEAGIRLLGLTAAEWYGDGPASAGKEHEGELFYLDDASALARLEKLAAA